MSMTPEQLRMTVEETALTPMGSSIAAAIVSCVIYFLYSCLAVHSYITTKFGWYDVVILSSSFRAVALACRAAYLSHYTPALAGTYLAFFNAGFSASGASVYLTLGAWFKHKGVIVFSERGDSMARTFCYLMTIPVLAFGPGLGVISAALIYGVWDTAPHAAYIGQRCRRATTYGILGIFVILAFWVIILNIRIMHVLRYKGRAAKPQRSVTSSASGSKKPELIWIFVITVAFGLMRGCTGVVALYKNKEFVWSDDTYFYSLNVLPDFLVLSIICWPKLLARISCAYPPQKAEDQEQGKIQENG